MTTSKPTSRQPRGPMTRASKGRFEQGLCLKFGQPATLNDRLVSVSHHRDTITEFQYPLGATDAEKIAMAETRMQEMWSEWSREIEQGLRSRNMLRDDLAESEKRLKAALGMLAAFNVVPRLKGNDFNDEIPF